MSPVRDSRSCWKNDCIVFKSFFVSWMDLKRFPTCMVNFSKLVWVSWSKTRIDVAFLSKGAIGGTIIGVSFRDLGSSVVVVDRRRCFQTSVEAVGGLGGRPQSIDWSESPSPDAIVVRMRLKIVYNVFEILNAKADLESRRHLVFARDTTIRTDLIII